MTFICFSHSLRPPTTEWTNGLKSTQKPVTVKVRNSKNVNIFIHFCLGSQHKLFKNCLSCGLILCTLNSKLQTCTFCAQPLNDSISLNVLSSDLQAKLAAANTLEDRLLSADSDFLFKQSLLDTEGPVESLQFISAGELEARAEEYERFKEKIESERSQKGTFNLSQMIFSDIDISCSPDVRE